MAYLGSIIVSLFLSMMSSMNSSSTQSSATQPPTAFPTGSPTSVVSQPTSVPTSVPTSTPVAFAPTPAPSPSVTSGAVNPSVLVFGGQGTNAGFLSCLMSDLTQAGLDPQQLDSNGLAALTSADLSKFSAFVVPEGNASVMGSALTGSARSAVRTAIQTGGLNFLGLGNGALLGLGSGAASTNPYVSAIPVALDLLQGLSSGAAGGGGSTSGSPLGVLQNIFGLFGNGMPALSQTPTSNGAGVSVLMPPPGGGSISCSQPPQVFSTGGAVGGAPAGQPIANPIMTLIQQALNRA